MACSRMNRPSTNNEQRIDLANRIALRPVEAAAVLGISDRTLRKRMRDDGLPHFRLDGVVCIPVDDLRKWMVDRMVSSHQADTIAAEILSDL